MSPQAEYCPHCGEPVSQAAHRQREQEQSTETPPEQRTVIDAQQQAGSTQQQTVVHVSRETPWWIIAAIFGAPIGCLMIPFLILGGLLLGTYGAPFVLGIGVALWIWYKYPGTRDERKKWAIVALVVGFVGSVLLTAIVIGVAASSGTGGP